MAIQKIEINQLTCERCEYVWKQREERLPFVCPRCKSPYWNKPRRNNKNGTKEKAMV